MQIVTRFHRKLCTLKKQDVKVNYEGVRERGSPNVNWQPIECLGLTEECVGRNAGSRRSRGRIKTTCGDAGASPRLSRGADVSRLGPEAGFFGRTDAVR